MSQRGYALLRISRTLFYDDHLLAGGGPPDIRHDTSELAFDFDARAPEELPVIRYHTARIAVPNEHRSSWELALGQGYKLLVVTATFSQSEAGIIIDGRIKSNYQTQLNPFSATIGPNAYHLRSSPLTIGRNSVVGVLEDAVTGREFREYQEIEVEEVMSSLTEPSLAGTTESAEAQERRWDEWKSIRKSSL
ncbi:MAG: hypothetical protein ABIS84_03240 [Arachnia sp.]